MTTQYVALLRGINVGGNNLIKMADLKQCLVDAGFTDVATYIQSGNVLFSAEKTSTDALLQQFNAALSKTFNYSAPVVLRSLQEMEVIVASAPDGFGTNPDTYRYDVLFLKEPLTAPQAMQSLLESISLKEGVDAAAEGPDVLYFRRLIARATQSHLNKVASIPIYQSMTIRNWNTTTKLLAMMHERTNQ